MAKQYVADKATLDYLKYDVDKIDKVLMKTITVTPPESLDKNYIADKGTLDSAKTELEGKEVLTNRGAVSVNLANNGESYTIPKGYHDGNGKVTSNISNLVAENIKSGVTVGGVLGTAVTVGYKEESYSFNGASNSDGYWASINVPINTILNYKITIVSCSYQHSSKTFFIERINNPWETTATAALYIRVTSLNAKGTVVLGLTG